MSDRIVPEPATLDNASITGLDQLHAHLDELLADASKPFDAKIFDDVELQLTEDNIPGLLPTLLPPLTTILKSTTQDPTPCLTLTIKLLAPLSLARCLSIADPPALKAALASPLPGANLLALAILHKAAASPGEAAILSTIPDVFEDLVRCWLDAHDVGVAEKAARVLGDVLETDCPAVVQPAAIQAQQLNGDSNNGNELVPRPRQPGHGRLWSLLLEHRPMASLIPHYATPGGDGDRSLRQVSLSQGRVLRLVPRLASLNMTAVASSRLSDIFAVDGDEAPGLLPWAALQMVDRGDALMHLNLIDFFETLVSVMRVSPNRTHAVDSRLAALVKAAVATDDELAAALRSLPDRTVEEEAEPLRDYIKMLLG